MADTQHVDAGAGFNPLAFLLEGQNPIILILVIIFLLIMILLVIPHRGWGRKLF